MDGEGHEQKNQSGFPGQGHERKTHHQPAGLWLSERRGRRVYLKERRHELWRELAGSGKLTAHLLDIDKTASEWMDRMLPQMMKAAGVTEELKARDQMAWIGLVNNCKAQVEEIIFSGLIYV